MSMWVVNLSSNAWLPQTKGERSGGYRSLYIEGFKLVGGHEPLYETEKSQSPPICVYKTNICFPTNRISNF